MTPHEVDGTLERRPKLHERLDDAITNIIETRAWSLPARKLFGKDATSRRAHFTDIQTGSSLVLTQVRTQIYVLGVPISVGEVSQAANWTIREDPTSEYVATLLYHNNSFFVGARVTYYNDQDELHDPKQLGYFYDRPATFPSPYINYESSGGYEALTFILENKVGNQFTETTEQSEF